MVGALAHGQSFDVGRAGRMVVHGFTSRASREDGTPHWELSGARALLTGSLATIEDARVLFHTEDGECTQVTTPKCRFNQTTNVGESDAPIQAESRTMTLAGLGYRIFVNEQRLYIRSNVRMTVRYDKHLDPEALLLPKSPGSK